MNKTLKRTLALMATTMALASPAIAHPDHQGAAGLVHGALHPLQAFDHIAVMVAVGIIAARLGGRALWLLPLSFMAMMAIGAVTGLVGIQVPAVESAILLSVLVLGGAAVLRMRPSEPVAVTLVGIFALFHGHAHGTEMPVAASGLAYGLGFLAATAVLHLTGIRLGLALERFRSARAATVAR